MIKNLVFVRNDTPIQSAKACGRPTFAFPYNITNDKRVLFTVDWPRSFWDYARKDWRLGFRFGASSSGTRILPMDKFLEEFSPDYNNEYAEWSCRCA